MTPGKKHTYHSAAICAEGIRYLLFNWVSLKASLTAGFFFVCVLRK